MSTTRQSLTDDLSSWGRDVGAAGRSLWLAGLGAMATVGGEARELLDDLVERGSRYEKERIEPLEERLEGLARRAVSFGDEVGEKFSDQVEGAVRQTAQRLGVPTTEDYERLSARLTMLGEKLERAAEAATK